MNLSLILLLGAAVVTTVAAADTVPRNVKIDGQRFVLAGTNNTVVLAGPNVVVKGPPYLPSVEDVEGTGRYCVDVVNDECTATGTCSTCYSFTEADVAHVKSMGWNTIRLGVVWAGAQPVEGGGLDPAFVQRLHALLDLTDRTGLHVVLDNHGDMVGSAGCGNGVPMWVQLRAAGELIGLPLSTALPYSLVPSLRVTELAGYDHCGEDQDKWTAFAGDPNYNLLNECCLAMNSPNPAALGWTKISQQTMDYVMSPGEGRDAFVDFWRLLAREVAGHPSAVAAELMNEPMTIHRTHMYDTWRACAEAILLEVPDMSVSLSDVGEGAMLPAAVTEHADAGAGMGISADTLEYIKKSDNLFYAWHWYGSPSVDAALANALAVGSDWDVPTFATEFMSCELWTAVQAAGVSHSYWHYSSYCDTGPAFGDKAVPAETFGACILGWAGGDSSYSC